MAGARPNPEGWVAEESTATATLQKELNEWVEEEFDGWEAPEPRALDAKVVRDPIHDFVRLDPHEVGVWDTPIVQRLRGIHQTALTCLVYPGLTHSRFEHSLGVFHVAERMLESLKRSSSAPDIEPQTCLEVRLAALLHDVGHVAFSHLGDVLLSAICPGLIHELRADTVDGDAELFDGVDLGEVLSYLIITCPAFRNTLRERIFPRVGHVNNVSLRDLNLKRVGRLVIGKPYASDPRWPSDIVNGSFDADKIDYLMRDCHYSGIRAEIDTSRLLHSLTITNAPDWNGALAVKANSVNYLEQILLTKLMLFTAVYHHHKVRAVERMFQSVVEDSLPDKGGFLPNSVKGCLRLTEASFFTDGLRNELSREGIQRLVKRQLLKRCLILDRNTVEEADQTRLKILMNDLARPAAVQDLRERIYEKMPGSEKAPLSDLWIDAPRPPDVDEEADQCPVEVGQGSVRRLSELMPAGGWVRTYVAHRLRGHVFHVAAMNPRQDAAMAAMEVLSDPPYRVRMKPVARTLALKE